ncbi:hypothetical protein B0A48_05037 [Cryoendolithus antarcticus]|uniref:Uncharacterized protein n=1 Tax=Cryoendolithus antarcticus TaxID=1507870 RepID=A0A1V8TE30_9PEZI|nr:hypothetical protein B0A48_05037 [Cryoendolithus antarcticus]
MAPKPTTTLIPHQVLQLTNVCRAMTKRPDIDYEVFRQLGGYSSAFNARKSFHALMRAVLASGTEGGDGAKAGKGKKRKVQSMDDDDEVEGGEEGATVANKQKGVSAEEEGVEEVVQAEEGKAEDAGVEEGDEEGAEGNGEAEE